MNLLLFTVPFAPVLAAFLTLVFGRKLPRQGGWINFAGAAISLVALFILGQTDLRFSTDWFSVGDFALTVGLRLDSLSRFMAWIVGIVSLLVNLYSIAYMKDETDQPRFFALMSFFAGAMLALVLADSLLLLFMAWEMVGLASFGLIGFHFTEEKSRRAAQKAFLLTRLGDFGFLLGWLIVLNFTRTTDLETLLTATSQGAIAAPMLTLVALLFFLAAVGKSAQLPLTAWLPDAMAGPTPVSALIHSATMVAAGVFLILRIFPVYAASQIALDVILWTGAITAVFAALTATAQYDLKRVLAWSTVSQLGEMMLALGLAGPIAAAFHLAAHAFFKSTLFLTAGAIEHSTDSRDLRELGGLWRKLPVITVIFAVAALALAGFPPFAGFWSEEEIIKSAVSKNAGWAVLMILLIFLAGIYIGRAGTAVFAFYKNAKSPAAEKTNYLMLAPMILLAVGAFAVGFVLKNPIEHLLPFETTETEIGIWRYAAIAASVFGLASGAWRVKTAGAVSFFGEFPQTMANGLQTATRAAGQAAMFAAKQLGKIEQAFDAAARIISATTIQFARSANIAEQGFDWTAQTIGASTMQAADASETAEKKGFDDGIDWFAALFARAGGGLRPFQTGKIYLNSMTLVVFVLLMGAVFVLIWW